jgi:hypothetical protein
MRCVVNLLTGRFVASRGVSALPRMFEHKRGDSGEVRLEFCEGFATATIPAGSEIIYGVKLRGEYDSAPLMTVTNFVLDAGIYSGTAAFDLDAIDAALNLDADTTNDLETLDCMAELTWKVPGGGWLSTNTMHAVISNDVNRADDSLIERIADIPARWASATLSDLGVAGQVEAPIKIVVDGVALWFVIAAGDEDAGDGYVLNEGGLTAAEVLLEFEAYINDGEPVAAGSSFVLRDGTWDDFTALIVDGELVVSTNTAGVGGNALAVSLVDTAAVPELEWDGATMTGGRASKSFDSGDFIATFEREPGSELTAEEQAIARADLGIGEAHTNAEVNTAIAASPATSATAMGLGTGDAPTFAGLKTTGNVGVGTTTPQNKLHVSGDFNGAVQISVDNPNSGNASFAGLLLQGQGNNFALRNWGDQVPSFANVTEFISTAGGSSFVFAPSNSERMRIDSTGNVGIGTTAPSDKLDVVGNINVVGSSARIGFNAGNMAVKDEGGYKLGFQTYNSTSGTITTKMVLDTNGNVGIGTNNPAAKIEVVGSGTAMRVSNSSTGSGSTAIQLGAYTANATGVYGAHIRTYHNFGGGGASSLAFETNGTTERMRITSAGNVGIGTTTPAEKLDVVGNIKASGTVKTGSLTVAVATASSSATAVAAGAGASVYITDETGGATLAVSDGTVWRRVADRAEIS